MSPAANSLLPLTTPSIRLNTPYPVTLPCFIVPVYVEPSAKVMVPPPSGFPRLDTADTGKWCETTQVYRPDGTIHTILYNKTTSAIPPVYVCHHFVPVPISHQVRPAAYDPHVRVSVATAAVVARLVWIHRRTAPRSKAARIPAQVPPYVSEFKHTSWAPA